MAARRSETCALWIGPTDGPFGQPAQALAEIVQVRRLDPTTELEASVRGADLAVFAIEHPGAALDGPVDLLRRNAPLARTVAIVGPWAEGCFAKQRPPLGVHLFTWSAATAAIRRMALAIAENRPDPAWLPPTASIEEQLAWRPEIALGKPRPRGLIGVACWRRSDFEAVRDLIEPAPSIWLRQGGRAATMEAFVAIGLAEELPRLLQAHRRANGLTESVAVVEGLRPHEAITLRAAGYDRVLSRVEQFIAARE